MGDARVLGCSGLSFLSGCSISWWMQVWSQGSMQWNIPSILLSGVWGQQGRAATSLIVTTPSECASVSRHEVVLEVFPPQGRAMVPGEEESWERRVLPRRNISSGASVFSREALAVMWKSASLSKCQRHGWPIHLCVLVPLWGTTLAPPQGGVTGPKVSGTRNTLQEGFGRTGWQNPGKPEQQHGEEEADQPTGFCFGLLRLWEDHFWRNGGGSPTEEIFLAFG